MKIKNLLYLLCATGLSGYAQNTINVTLSPDNKGPYSGRLVVYTVSDTTKQFGRDNTDNEAAFAIDVKDWKSGETRVIDRKAFPYISTVDSLKSGYYKLVAILDTNNKERSRMATGNLYSKKEALLKIEKGKPANTALVLNASFPERKFQENDSVKEEVFQSPVLTKFRKEAGIILPSSYTAKPEKHYPVVFIIPGWSGTHFNALSKSYTSLYKGTTAEEKIYVFLNPESNTPFGLHAFVDSRVNGPWGEALVTEFIPYLTAKYRITKDPELHFITGQSSGGYGAIWLALHYPEHFGGCWATAPDPVDFTSFTGVNIYKDKNFYTGDDGKERGFYKTGEAYQTTIRQAQQKELLEGDGGQQQSFEAEFGLMANNNKPKPLFDRKTGKIDKSVAKVWQDYDLAQYVVANWKKIKGQAAGKIKIYAGSKDNFGFNESVVAFAEKIKKADAAIYTEIIPEADHFNTRNPQLNQRIHDEMDAIIKSKAI